MTHCVDNAGDRKVGEHWERQFCRMAGQVGKMFTPHQIGRPQPAAAFAREGDGYSKFLLPDVTIWSAPGEHHEIKHKRRTRFGSYGLERYRLDALIRFANTTGQDVWYTIHDWEDGGASTSRQPIANDIRHWWCANVVDISHRWTSTGWNSPSYVNGERSGQIEIVYWDRHDFFHPLTDVWT